MPKPNMTRPDYDPIQIQRNPQPSPQEIAFRAYQVWEAAGRPSGRAVEHWLAAEAQLRAAVEPRLARSRLSGHRYGLVLSEKTPP